jgi:steroid delta-isomerase-like uncharacterized protein
MSDENVALVRRWIDCWSAHDLDGLTDLVAPDYVHHEMSGADRDLAAFAAGLGAVIAAFPDIEYEVRHVIASGDLVAVSLSGTGHHQGGFYGVAPTGDLTTFRGSYHCRIDDGRIAEDWDVFDLLSPLLALGARIVTTG